VLIVFLTHAISYSSFAALGQQVSSKVNVRITYPPPLQQVPIGNSLTIFGTSKYNTSNDCTVYANSNDLKFQKVTAVGPSGNNNYSSWIFTSAKNYHPIKTGINKITAKISCKANPNNLTAYYISNVTGIIVRNNINSFNNMNQQSNSLLESKIHNNLNNNNNGNAIASSNNNGKMSNSPFWFPNLFHNDVRNGNDNNTKDNSNSKTIQSLQESGKVLGISIRVAKNPIAWGNEQTIKISVFDPNSNQPVSNAIVTGSILTFPTLKTGLTKEFMLVTNSGTASYSWLIADNNTKSSVYSLIIHVSAPGYNPTSALTKFTVMPVVLSNQNNIQNKTSNNIHNNKNTPAISTLHT